MCPRIFHIYGPLWVNGYGLMIALGFLVFTALTYRHPWRRRLLSDEKYLNVLFVGFLSAILGGRFLFVLFEFASFDTILEIFYPWVGGFSSFGSIIFVLIAVSIYLRKIGVAILPFFDLIALYAPVLHIFARIGCFLAGCCYGVPTQRWWGVALDGVPLHPTQLYSAAASLLIFSVLYGISKRYYRMPGTIILLYLMLECSARFTIDFWRGDKDFATRVIVAALFFAAFAAFFILRRFRRRAR